VTDARNHLQRTNVQTSSYTSPSRATSMTGFQQQTQKSVIAVHVDLTIMAALAALCTLLACPVVGLCFQLISSLFFLFLSVSSPPLCFILHLGLFLRCIVMCVAFALSNLNVHSIQHALHHSILLVSSALLLGFHSITSSLPFLWRC